MKRWRPLETAVLMTLRRLGLEARLVNVHESSEPPPAPSLEILDPDWGIAAFVDTETTGLDYHHDEVIELAIVLFAFDRNTGSIIGVLDEHVGLRDPSCEISRGATAVNGIEWKMVQGHCLDKPRIETLFEKAEFLISHNAPFDLNFVHHIFPAIQLKPWLCSMNGIDWYGKGFQSRGLQELLGCHGIRPLKAHRGLDDCKSAIALLALRSPSGRTYLAELLEGREASKLQRTILDDHAAYGDMIRHYYEARESDPTAFEAAIRACTMQISIAQEAARELKKRSRRAPLPGHPGFDRLTLIRERQGEYKEAVRLCHLAMKQGWEGKWEARISRCEKKLEKTAPTTTAEPKKRGRPRKSTADNGA